LVMELMQELFIHDESLNDSMHRVKTLRSMTATEG
jgi:hypothetical protein